MDTLRGPLESSVDIARRRLTVLKTLIRLLLFLAVSACAMAGDVNLQWDPNTEPDLAGYKVYFGTASRQYGPPIVIGLEASYTFQGLPAGAYYFAVTAFNSAGLESSFSNEVSTVIATSGTSLPTISNVSFTDVRRSSIVVYWTTNVAADSQVEYGTTSAYGSAVALDTTRITSHAQMLSGLVPLTRYHFRVKSGDAAGNLAVSPDFTFTTGTDLNIQTTLFYPANAAGKADAGSAAPGERLYSGLALANLDSTEANLTLTAYDDSGNPMTGPGITNPVARTLHPGEQFPIIDEQLFGDSLRSRSQLGWVNIESNGRKLAGFFLVFDTNLSVLDGTNFSTKPTPNFVLPEVESQGYTRLNIANPGASDADVRMDLMRSDGTVRASIRHSVKAYGAWTADLRRDVFPGVTPDPSDYIRGTSGGGVLPFELLGKEFQYVECLNGQDASVGATTLYSPQLVFGSSWRSSLSVVNLEGRQGTVTLTYISDDGRQIGTEQTVPIAPYGKIYIDNPVFFQPLYTSVLLQGYVEIVSSGVKLAGSVIFGDPGRRQFSSALPLIGQLQTAAVFSQVASNDVYYTGLAMLNPGTSDATVNIDLFDGNGSLASSAIRSLPAGQREAKLLTEIFPALQDQSRTSGYFLVTSSAPLASFAIIGTNTSSVLGAVPPQEVPR